MKNRDHFLQDCIEKVRSLAISFVVEKRVRLIKKGPNYMGLCPFHNDKHIGSFVVTDRKGIFKCFACGTGGDAIKFIAELDGVNYVESAMNIALNFGIINVSEYEDFFSRKYDSEKAKKIEKVYMKKDLEKMKRYIAEPDILHKVFTIFSRGESLMEGKNRLSDEHLEYLKAERGLSDKDIEDGGYFTFPSKWVLRHFISALKSEGHDEEILKDVPGFYKIKETNSYDFIRYKGIGIPIKNAKGQIVGIQVRKDKKQENVSRYIWFSSSYFENDEEERYEHCTSSGSPIDVVYPDKIRNQTLIITEGRFKAKKIADTWGSVAISVQGVGTWEHICKEITSIQKLHRNIPFKYIFIAFDADMAYNIEVYKQAMKMAVRIQEELKDMMLSIYYCMWAVEYGKGIDDLILNGMGEMVDKMKRDDFENIYQSYIHSIVESEVKSGKYESLMKVPPEVMKTYFYRDVLPRFDKYKNIS